MSSEKNPVHYPINPDKFEFDEEVAKIFPNMARRSIPMYREMHRLHARMLVSDYLKHQENYNGKTYRVLDIGASRCDFLDAIYTAERRENLTSLNMQYTPCEKSQAMIEETKNQRRMRVQHYDLADPEDTRFDSEQFDAVCMHYVMQFIPPDKRFFCFERLSRMIPAGGLLFFGEKETLKLENSGKTVSMGDVAHEHYIDWRVENGYSREEIEAKSAALKNAMWEASFLGETQPMLRDTGFSRIIPTTRYGVFHSFVAMRANLGGTVH